MSSQPPSTPENLETAPQIKTSPEFLTQTRLLTALVCVVAVFVAARLLQLAMPLEVPRAFQAWVLRPVLWKAPLEVDRVSALAALLPWLCWGGILLLGGEYQRRAGGPPPCSRVQLLALAFVPGYRLLGLPHASGALAKESPRRTLASKRGASGLMGLHLAVAAALVMEAWKSTPERAFGVLVTDSVLLLVQVLMLLGHVQALRAFTAPAPAPQAAESSEASEAPAAVPADASAAPDLDCPECPAPAPLLREPGQPGHHCGRCGGDLLSPMEQGALLMEEAAPEPTGRQVACASCGGSADTVALRGGALSRCAACGVTWLRAGMLHRLTGGRHGRPRTRPTPSPERRAPRLLSPVMSGAALAGFLCVAVGGASLLSAGPPCASNTRHERTVREDGWVLHQCLDANDKQQGTSWLRDPRGRLREQTAWTAGQRSGDFRHWDGSGRLQVEGAYQRNLSSGEWRYYAESGALVARSSFSKGQLHGEALEQAEDGTPQELRHHEDGRLHGAYTRYFPSGRKRVEGHYRQGRRHGDWAQYDESGKRVDATWWNDGRRALVLGVESEKPASPAVAVAAATVPTPPAPAPADALYGGRPLEWWDQRVRRLWVHREAPEGASRYALTVHRAGLNGLEVEETNAGPKVVIAPRPQAATTRRESP